MVYKDLQRMGAQMSQSHDILPNGAEIYAQVQ